MTSLQMDIRVPLGRPLRELADFAVLCEQAGLGGVGVPDHHHTGRDAYLAVAAMALRTSRLLLYPATSMEITRHPLVLSSLVNSLDELAPGRAMLTVARGFRWVEKVGEPQARRQWLCEVVLALRGLLGEGHATLDGHDLDVYHRPAAWSRVIVLASGPKLLELAGEVADGAMMLVGLDPRGVEAARELVCSGAARAGPDPATLEEILIVPVGLGDEQVERAWLSWPDELARRSSSSAPPSSAQRGCCGPGTRSDCGTPSCSRRTPGRVTTTFPAPRSMPSVRSSAPRCGTPARTTAAILTRGESR